MKQRGFTLIELMITITIIGILLSLAVPAYQNYVIRARVTEGLNMAETAKMAVSEAVLSENQLPKNQDDANYQSPKATANVASIVIGKEGIITIQYTKAAGKGSLILKPTLEGDNTLTWSCQGGTLDKTYRPSSCR